MFYRIVDNKLYDYADYKYAEDCLKTTIVTQEELDEHSNKVIVKDGRLVRNPNYDKEEEAKEKERIGNLTCTKRVLVLMLQKLQYSWKDVVRPLIYADDAAALEWELCVELQRKNPLLDMVGAQLGISPEQIDLLFRAANGEITEEEFLGE